HAGVAVVDMGAGSTGIAVYTQGSLAHACAVPIGGDHFTNDIAVGLGTPIPEAEKIKHTFGAVRADQAAASTAIEVPSAGDQPPRILPLRRLGECIEPRAQELVRLIHAEVTRMGGLGAGVVLSGGAGRLTGLPEMLQSALDLPVRFAQPALIEGMPDAVGEPEFAFLVGGCYYAHRLLSRQVKSPSLWEKLRQKWETMA
ncbi:MAG: cell division protein FtsA, partial [Terriglobales bacterium]